MQEHQMTKTMTAALLALALAGGSLAVVPAKADGVTVVTPGIAFGYNDGYWDQGHAWHTWANSDARVTYQRDHHDHFYGWRHDRDHDLGWRERDHWWH
jgi:hypothetical protein